MRLAFISDLHTDLSQRNHDLLGALVEVARAAKPDVFLVAGDLAEKSSDVAASLERLAAIPALRLYLAGNHDLFVEGDPQSAATANSQEKFETILPRVAAAAGFGYLGLEPVRWGEIAIVGVPGWYDFSLRDPGFDAVADLPVYRTGAWRGTRAYDRGHVFWPRREPRQTPGAHPAAAGGDAWAGDEEICTAMLERLQTQLAAVRAAPTVVAAVHVLPCLDLVQRGAFGEIPFFDAYLGSSRLGAGVEQAGNVKVVVSGHLHRVASLERRGIRWLASPVGDARRSSLDLAALARERLGLIEI